MRTECIAASPPPSSCPGRSCPGIRGTRTDIEILGKLPHTRLNRPAPQYVTRCPFSLSRLVKVTKTGQVVYKAEKDACRAFPDPRGDGLRPGAKRNFEILARENGDATAHKGRSRFSRRNRRGVAKSLNRRENGAVSLAPPVTRFHTRHGLK